MIDSIEYKGRTITIDRDEDPENPREWGNIGTMICFHNRYDLGDKHDYNPDNYDGWDELKAAIEKEEDAVVMLPLGLYDHSGITMYVSSQHDTWDGGQVGWIIATRKSVMENYNVKRITKKILAKVEKHLRAEVEVYDNYLTGEVYGYSTDTDSCWGYFGDDGLKEAIREAKSAIDYQLEKEAREKEKKTKIYIKNNVPLEYRTV
jgi:hypothetical protein